MKEKKKINGWKLTAIISLIINGLTALLLTIGLASPRSYVKTNAYSQPTEKAYLYTIPIDYSSKWNEFRSSSSLWNVIEDLATNHRSDFSIVTSNPSTLTYVYAFSLSNNEKLMSCASSDFNDSRETTLINVDFEVLTSGEHQGECVLKYIYCNGNFFPINRDYNNGYNLSCYYNFLISDNYSLNYLYRLIYDYQGTNEGYKDFVIGDNWNPNKYISIASDSIGLLYKSPGSPDSWMPNPPVVWVAPTYIVSASFPDGGSVSNVSTLGYIEIPLLFESNGEMFNGIRLYYDVYHHYIDKDGNVQHTSPESGAVGGYNLHDYHYGFVYMSYTYELLSNYGLGTPFANAKEKVVSAVPVYQIQQNIVYNNFNYREYIYEPFESYKWLREEYKIIHTFDYSKPSLNRVGINQNVNSSLFAINQLTIEQVLEYDMNVVGTPVGSNNYVGNVFVLIRQGFDSILPLLAVSILPGITIGMLIFIPLVLTIIIVVIKLVKR